MTSDQADDRLRRRLTPEIFIIALLAVRDSISASPREMSYVFNILLVH